MLNVKPFDQARALCGPAVLKMVLSYFKINKSEKEITRMTGSNIAKATAEGIEAEALLKVVKKLGLHGRIRDNSNITEIRKYVNQKRIPVIVEWFSTFGTPDAHFSVVVGIDKENIYLQDPQIGHIRAMRIKDFRRLWFSFPHDYIRERSEINLRRVMIIHTKSREYKKQKKIRVPKSALNPMFMFS